MNKSPKEIIRELWRVSDEDFREVIFADLLANLPRVNAFTLMKNYEEIGVLENILIRAVRS